jgi:hypothetical protein
MSIAPIDYSAFQRSPVGIEAVLARGGSALSSILRDAMQVGRDRANRQASQEKDFVEEQRRDINLNQRRGELRQQDFEDTRRFGEDVRQFDTKFGENVRQFDQNFNENVRQFGVRETQAEAQLGLQREAGSRDKLRLEGQLEEEKFRRENILPAELEIKTKELEAETARVAGIRDEAERRKAEADLKLSRETNLGEALMAIDSLIKANDPRSLAEAQSQFTSIVENPAYGVDEGTRERLAQRLELPTDGGRGSFSRSAGDIDPRESLTLDELDEAIRIEKAAIDKTSTGYGSTKDNRNLLQLEAIRARKQAQTDSLKNGASQDDVTSMADFLKRGRESRGQQ